MLSRQTPRLKQSSCFSTTKAGATGTCHQAKCKHLKLFLCFPDVYMSLTSATPQGSTHLSTLSNSLASFVCLVFLKVFKVLGKVVNRFSYRLWRERQRKADLSVFQASQGYIVILSQNNILIKIQRSHAEWAADTSHTVPVTDASGQPPVHFVSLASCACVPCLSSHL